MKNKKWELVSFCEIDKYAEKSYCAIHGVDKSLNLGDISQVNENEIKDFNFMVWGFPCTDISLSGKTKGFVDENGNKTRSGMYYEGMRILRAKQPNVSIIENVKALTGSKFKKEFEMILNDLDDAGYNSYYKILDSKDFGISQHRERVFIVSIRKDLDNGLFDFPIGFENNYTLEDILLDEVPERFYLSDESTSRFISELNNPNVLIYDSKQMYREGKSREYDKLCPTLTARDYKDPLLVNITELNKRHGLPYDSKIRLRKLTPQEQFMLMGFPDEAYLAVKDLISPTQLYKQTGNSIVVDVLYYIFLELYKAMPYVFDNLTLGSFFSGIGAPEVALNRLYEAIDTGNFTRP